MASFLVTASWSSGASVRTCSATVDAANEDAATDAVRAEVSADVGDASGPAVFFAQVPYADRPHQAFQITSLSAAPVE